MTNNLTREERVHNLVGRYVISGTSVFGNSRVWVQDPVCYTAKNKAMVSQFMCNALSFSTKESANAFIKENTARLEKFNPILEFFG